MPLPFSILFSLLILPCYSIAIPINNRRTLHQPFFPSYSPPPLQPPTPSIPKYPFSTNSQPFFPSYPSPPSPPSSPSNPTFPANISSLIFPSSHSAPPHSPSSKLVPAILIPLFVLAVLSLTLAFLFHRRRCSQNALRSDGQRLFAGSSDGQKPPTVVASTTASDYLYLGTLVSSRCRNADPGVASPAGSSPYRKLGEGSPELCPLPPLSRQVRRNVAGGEGCCSSDEKFYSPRISSAERQSPGLGSSSRRTFEASAMAKPGSRSLSLSSSSSSSSPSYAPSSPNLSSPAPSKSTARSADPGVCAPSLPPPPPPPPPPLRPLTPSPPKRKLPSHSPPSSPLDNNSDRNSRSSESSLQVLRSPATSGGFTRYPFAFGGPSERWAPTPPPPPPPPPPPAGYWENKVRSNPEFLLTPKANGFKNSAKMAVPPPEVKQDAEKSEENVKPKLKPLHWDKVRASSDRAMVWDQLKCSSFQ